jgi:hypothetical protein
MCESAISEREKLFQTDPPDADASRPFSYRNWSRLLRSFLLLFCDAEEGQEDQLD